MIRSYRTRLASLMMAFMMIFGLAVPGASLAENEQPVLGQISVRYMTEDSVQDIPYSAGDPWEPHTASGEDGTPFRESAPSIPGYEYLRSEPAEAVYSAAVPGSVRFLYKQAAQETQPEPEQNTNPVTIVEDGNPQESDGGSADTPQEGQNLNAQDPQPSEGQENAPQDPVTVVPDNTANDTANAPAQNQNANSLPVNHDPGVMLGNVEVTGSQNNDGTGEQNSPSGNNNPDSGTPEPQGEQGNTNPNTGNTDPQGSQSGNTESQGEQGNTSPSTGNTDPQGSQSGNTGAQGEQGSNTDSGNNNPGGEGQGSGEGQESGQTVDPNLGNIVGSNELSVSPAQAVDGQNVTVSFTFNTTKNTDRLTLKMDVTGLEVTGLTIPAFGNVRDDASYSVVRAFRYTNAAGEKRTFNAMLAENLKASEAHEITEAAKSFKELFTGPVDGVTVENSIITVEFDRPYNAETDTTASLIYSAPIELTGKARLSETGESTDNTVTMSLEYAYKDLAKGSADLKTARVHVNRMSIPALAIEGPATVEAGQTAQVTFKGFALPDTAPKTVKVTFAVDQGKVTGLTLGRISGEVTINGKPAAEAGNILESGAKEYVLEITKISPKSGFSMEDTVMTISADRLNADDNIHVTYTADAEAGNDMSGAEADHDLAVTASDTPQPQSTIPVSISAVDAENGTPVKGVTLHCFVAAGEGESELAPAVTNAEGRASMTLDRSGKYRFACDPMEGYNIDRIDGLSADGPADLAGLESLFITVYLRKIPAATTGATKITLETADTHAPISGAAFVLTRSDGSVVANLTTDAEGGMLLEDLEPGDYTLVQSTSILGYDVLSGRVVITIEAGVRTDVHLTNSRKKVSTGTLIVTVRDSETQEPVTGDRIRLLNLSSEAQEPVILPTDTDGQAVFTDLEAGTYKVTQEEPAEGYTQDTTTAIARIVAGEATAMELFRKKEVVVEPLDPITVLPLAFDPETAEVSPNALFTMHASGYNAAYTAGPDNRISDVRFTISPVNHDTAIQIAVEGSWLDYRIASVDQNGVSTELQKTDTEGKLTFNSVLLPEGRLPENTTALYLEIMEPARDLAVTAFDVTEFTPAFFSSRSFNLRTTVHEKNGTAVVYDQVRTGTASAIKPDAAVTIAESVTEADLGTEVRYEAGARNLNGTVFDSAALTISIPKGFQAAGLASGTWTGYDGELMVQTVDARGIRTDIGSMHAAGGSLVLPGSGISEIVIRTAGATAADLAVSGLTLTGKHPDAGEYMAHAQFEGFFGTAAVASSVTGNITITIHGQAVTPTQAPAIATIVPTEAPKATLAPTAVPTATPTVKPTQKPVTPPGTSGGRNNNPGGQPEPTATPAPTAVPLMVSTPYLTSNVTSVNYGDNALFYVRDLSAAGMKKGATYVLHLIIPTGVQVKSIGVPAFGASARVSLVYANGTRDIGTFTQSESATLTDREGTGVKYIAIQIRGVEGVLATSDVSLILKNISARDRVATLQAIQSVRDTDTSVMEQHDDKYNVSLSGPKNTAAPTETPAPTQNTGSKLSLHSVTPTPKSTDSTGAVEDGFLKPTAQPGTAEGKEGENGEAFYTALTAVSFRIRQAEVNFELPEENAEEKPEDKAQAKGPAAAEPEEEPDPLEGTRIVRVDSITETYGMKPEDVQKTWFVLPGDAYRLKESAVNPEPGKAPAGEKSPVGRLLDWLLSSASAEEAILSPEGAIDNDAEGAADGAQTITDEQRAQNVLVAHAAQAAQSAQAAQNTNHVIVIPDETQEEAQSGAPLAASAEPAPQAQQEENQQEPMIRIILKALACTLGALLLVYAEVLFIRFRNLKKAGRQGGAVEAETAAEPSRAPDAADNGTDA